MTNLDAENLNIEGMRLAGQGKWSEAIERYLTAIRIDPRYYEPHNNLGIAYYNSGAIKEAIQEFETTILLKPDYPDAYNNLGVYYYELKDFDKAVNFYKAATRADPDYLAAHYNLGKIYYDTSQLEDAESEFIKSIEIEPNLSDAHNNLGNVYSLKKDYERAISEYEEALRTNPHSVHAERNLQRAQREKRRKISPCRFLFGVLGRLLSHGSRSFQPPGQSISNYADELQIILSKLSQPKYDLSEIPHRIELCRQALALVNREQDSMLWAQLQNELGNSLVETPLGKRAQNLEQAIAAFEAALQVRTREAFPLDWAATQNDMGIAYRHRIKGNQTQNLEKAIGAFNAALQVRTREASPIDWAMTQNNLGNTYLDRIKGPRTQNLEQAVAAFRNTLLVFTREEHPQRWASAQHNLGVAYQQRIEDRSKDNLEIAIAFLEGALQVRTRDVLPQQWATTRFELGNAYSIRRNGDPTQNLEMAIMAYRDALQVFRLDTLPGFWAKVQNSLGLAYQDRLNGSPAQNIEDAIVAFESVLPVFNRDTFPLDWAVTQNNLGIAYTKRIKGNPEHNLRCGIAAFENALSVFSRSAFPAKYERTQHNLGNLYFKERHWYEATAAYQAAIDVGEDLLTIAPSKEGKQVELAETSVLFVNTAYCLLQTGSPTEALLVLEKGKTRLLAEALALRDLNIDSLPAEQQAQIGTLLLTIRELETEYSLPTDDMLRRSNEVLCEALAETQSELSRITTAISVESLTFKQQGINLPDLLVLAPVNGALVIPLFTAQGSAVFIVPHGAQNMTDVHILKLNEFKLSDLNQLLVGNEETPGWLRKYIRYQSGESFTVWRTVIDEFTRELWDKLVSAIYARLVELKVNQIIVMSQGGLGLLPLHAAWRLVDGQKRYLLDDVEIRYVPSGQVLKTVQARNTAHQRKSALVVGVSQYTNLNDLPNVRVEVETIAECFGTTPLLDVQASRQAVIDQAAGKAYLHLSCHGNFMFGDVNCSALYLANDESLSMTDIVTKLNLDAVRLVTLSACETGITDISRNPDEFVGLPAAFMQVGALGVVSTLWSVEDRSTALLMERFYNIHLKQNKPAATALREAQHWLRDVTVGELLAYFEQQKRMSGKVAVDGVIDFSWEDPECCPYQEPYYWAPFVFFGV